MKKYFAEFIGTLVLTLLGCGTAVFVGCGESAGVFATAAAFGLSVIAMAYTISRHPWIAEKTKLVPPASRVRTTLGSCSYIVAYYLWVYSSCLSFCLRVSAVSRPNSWRGPSTERQ